MTVETASTLVELAETLPAEADPIAEGGAHLRLIKAVLKLDAVSQAQLAGVLALKADATALALKVSQTSATGSAGLPTGTTAQRDVTPAAGYTRYNEDYDNLEVYKSSGWGSLGGASGNGGDAVFYENDISVNFDKVIGDCTFKTIAASGLATNDQVTDASNDLANGAYVSIDSFGGAVPTGLEVGKQYFVVNSVANTSFQLSLTSGGAAIAFTGAAGALVLTNGKLKNAGVTGPLTFNAAVTVPSGSRLVIS